MYDSEYAIEVIMRNRREEMNRNLDRMARYNSFPVPEKSTKRIVSWMGTILVSIQNIFVS